jgi:hypothetical protein
MQLFGGLVDRFCGRWVCDDANFNLIKALWHYWTLPDFQECFLPHSQVCFVAFVVGSNRNLDSAGEISVGDIAAFAFLARQRFRLQ